MSATFGALLRPVFHSAHVLCILALFILSAPLCAAAVGPTISNVTFSPNPILAVGGVVTVTAQVTPSPSGLSSVVLYETYPNSGVTLRTVPMTVGSDGVTYSATVPVDLNTNSNAVGERLYVVAKDPANNETDATAAIQGLDNIPPSISNATSNPISIPAVGAVATVTAQVSDTGVGLSSVVLYETYPNSGVTLRTVPMTVGSDGITYSATVPVDLNTNSNAVGERLYIIAIDKANNQSTSNVTTQGNDNISPSINNIATNPSPIPVQGANVTVTAQVSDTGVGLSSVVLYETYPNSGVTLRTAPMTVGSDGITYSATVPVDLNSNKGASGERLYIIATDKANNQTNSDVATQGYSSVPATGLLPVLITADPSQPVLSPAYIVSGGTDLSLTINGINFATGAVVLFNGVQLQPASVTGRQIVVNVPAALVAQAGCYAVSVVDPSPSSASNTVTLTVYGLFSVSVPPAVAGGSVVTARVALNGPAPTDTVIGLSSSDSSVVRLFRAVIIPAGSIGATFAINTYRSHVTKMVTIRASEGILALTVPLTITGR